MNSLGASLWDWAGRPKEEGRCLSFSCAHEGAASAFVEVYSLVHGLSELNGTGIKPAPDWAPLGFSPRVGLTRGQIKSALLATLTFAGSFSLSLICLGQPPFWYKRIGLFIRSLSLSPSLVWSCGRSRGGRWWCWWQWFFSASTSSFGLKCGPFAGPFFSERACTTCRYEIDT